MTGVDKCWKDVHFMWVRKGVVRVLEWSTETSDPTTVGSVRTMTTPRNLRQEDRTEEN